MDVNEQEIRSIKTLVEQNSQVIEKIVNQLVGKYNREMEQFVRQVNEHLKEVKNNPNVEFDIVTLEQWMFELPTFMYFAGSGLELLGIEGDNAEAVKNQAFQEAHQQAEGTIPDKKASATLNTFTQHIVEISFKRAYKKLRMQLDHAELIYKSVSKVYAQRMAEEAYNEREGNKIKRARQYGDY